MVVLAAGASDRFGSPKQLARFRDQCLVRRATIAAQELAGSKVTVVLGAHSRLVEGELLDFGVRMVLNANWRDGLASSVRQGMITVPPATVAVLLMGIDMPLLDAQFLGEIVEEWSRDRSKILFCQSDRGAGLPAIVPRRYFKSLMSIKGDPGISSFFARHQQMSIIIERKLVQCDIDTPEDLEKIERALGA